MTDRPLMIRYLTDPANAITATGLAISVISTSLVTEGYTDAAVALILWALLADHLDGVVAKRTIDRPAIMSGIGEIMDMLADLVSAGVFPALLLMVIAGPDWWVIAVAVLAIGASALRLAVFHVLLKDNHHFIGVPTSWVVPTVALLFLMRNFIPAELFGFFLAGILLILAVLQVSSLRVPKLRGIGYMLITIYCSISSLILYIRSPTQ